MWKTLRLPKLIAVSRQKRIDPSARKRGMESCYAFVSQFTFDDGRVISGLLSDPGDSASLEIRVRDAMAPTRRGIFVTPERRRPNS
jgi:hypothetical protein